MKIAMACSEANPFVKTGGLADVTYALSKELVKLGEEVVIVLPLYNQVKAKCLPLEYVGYMSCHLAWREEGANVYYLEKDGIKYYFIENRHYFERDGIYGYDDDGERFAFYSVAFPQLLEMVGFKPDIIHAHDWQPGMVFCYIREKQMSFFDKTKFVMSIHNPAFQGILDKFALGDLFGLPDYLFDNGTVRFGDKVSSLKAGIMYANKVTTVSPNHRNELLTPEGSMGLNNVLIYKEYDFCGILNGIDYNEFNPEKDSLIAKNYGPTNFVTGKKANKKALLERFNIKDESLPLYSLVSRVTWQKGMSLVFAAARSLLDRGANIILLGSGEYDYEQEMERLRRDYPEHVGIYVGYNNELAHLIYAGSDFFMMPSLFEPCGLGQMIAQRYGTLPIVRRTGGLKDSVINYDSSNKEWSNGYGFDNFSEFDMIQTCHYAYDIFVWDNATHRQLVKNALLTDNSWEKSGNSYHMLYKEIVG